MRLNQIYLPRYFSIAAQTARRPARTAVKNARSFGSIVSSPTSATSARPTIRNLQSACPIAHPISCSYERGQRAPIGVIELTSNHRRNFGNVADHQRTVSRKVKTRAVSLHRLDQRGDVQRLGRRSSFRSPVSHHQVISLALTIGRGFAVFARSRSSMSGQVRNRV